MMTDASSICGAAMTPIQAVSWNPVSAVPSRRTSTWPKAQQRHPASTSETPVICPSSEGAPTIVTIPASETPIPVTCRRVGHSRSMITAITVPKTTSDCTRKMAGVASISASPEKVRPYWSVADTSAMTPSIPQWPRGTGTNQIRIRAAVVNRRPISSKGGK